MKIKIMPIIILSTLDTSLSNALVKHKPLQTTIREGIKICNASNNDINVSLETINKKYTIKKAEDGNEQCKVTDYVEEFYNKEVIISILPNCESIVDNTYQLTKVLYRRQCTVTLGADCQISISEKCSDIEDQT